MSTAEHHTVIGVFAAAATRWMRDTGSSQATVAQYLVEAHNAIGAERTTRIVFDPATQDTYERMKINAERIFRWLDELTKDRNLLPANFIPSFLAGLPDELRLWVANEMLRPAGLAARAISAEGAGLSDLPDMFRAMLTEGAEAEVAITRLLDGASAEELKDAHLQLTQDLDSRSQLLMAVESALIIGGHDVPRG